MKMSGSRFADTQVYAFFAAIIIVLMLLAGFFVDSADSEQRRLLRTELSLAAHEIAHSAKLHLTDKDHAALEELLRIFAAEHDISHLSLTDDRTGRPYIAGLRSESGAIAADTVRETRFIEEDGKRIGTLLLEKDIGDRGGVDSIVWYLLLSFLALAALVGTTWAGLRFFVIARSSKYDDDSLPFSPLAAIVSPFLKEDHPDFAALRPEQVATILRQSGFTMALVIANGAFLVASLWSHFPHELLIPWALILFGMAAVNLRVWYRNRNRPLPGSVSKRTLRRMTYHAGLLGLTWGVALTVFFTGTDTVGRFILIALGLGMAAGGTAALAFVPSAALAYMAAILVPAALRFATLEGEGFVTLSILCVLYAGSMGAFLGQAYHGFARNVLARHDQARQAETIALVLNAYEEQASDWLWETNRNLCLQSPPQRMERLLGRQPGTLAGACFKDLAGSQEDIGWPQLVTALSGQDSFRDLIVRCLDTEGEERWISLSGRKREDGRWHGVGSDVTVREMALIRLRAAMEEAKSSSRATTAFLAATSHELRTPLNAIIGFSQLLSSMKLSAEKTKDYVQTINEAGTHLLNIVNGILEMAQIEAGHKTLRLETIDLSDVVREAIEFLSLQSAQAATEIRFVPPSETLTLSADRQALRQVLLNVIGNALKFTPAGGLIEIEADIRAERIHLTVSDNGIGIAEEDVDRVLQPFAQADDRLERRYDGTGLGLPIAKSLIELHHGSLSIHSRNGGGTSVRITFPAFAEQPLQLARSG